MDLLDLIGDSRTDSLPAGFLRSVKIKYKHESSRVFPRPGSPAFINKKEECHGTDGQKRAGSAASIQSTPSFMSWKIPPRLIHGAKNTQLHQPPFPGTAVDTERVKQSSRASVTSRASVGSQKLPVSREKLDSGRETLPRLYSSGSARSVTSSGIKPLHESLPGVENRVRGTNWQGKSWSKPAEMDKTAAKQLHNHTQGECEICDTERIEETLQTLTRDGPAMPRGKLQYNPRRKPDLSRQSHYHTPKRLPSHVRQQFQTWHHLPIYTVPRDAAINKSAMFTQPHREYGRHFSIHPEWGLHKPLVL